MKWLKLFLILALILNLFLFLNTHFNQSPKHDDVYHYKLVEGIDRFGIPLIYRGEGIAYQYGSSLEGDYMNGLSHPPLGSYSLYLFYKLFSNSIFSLRFFGYIMSLFTVILIFKICGQIFSNKRKEKQVAYLASIFYLISPLVIQKSIIQSMDTLFYPALLSLFVYLFLKYENTKYNYILFGFLFGIILQIKYTTVCFLVLSMFIYYLLKKQYYRAVLVTFWTSIIGFLLFFSIYGIYSLYFSGSFLATSSITLGRVTNFMGLTVILRHILTSIAYDSFWLSPGLLLLLFFALIARVKSFFCIKNLQKIDFLWIFILITWAAYSIKAPDIYYKFPLYSLILIVAIGSFPLIFNIDYKKLIIALPIITLLLYLLPDPFLILPSLLPFTSITIPYILILLLYFVPLIILVFIRKNIRFSIYILLIVSFFMVLNFQHAMADHSTLMYYGEKGYEETIDYLKARLAPEDLYVAREDVGFLVGGKFYRSEELTIKNDCGIDNSLVFRQATPCGTILGPYNINHAEKLKLKQLKYAVYSSYLQEYMGGFSEEVQKIINSDYRLEKQFGHFRIYRKIDLSI